MTGPDVPDFSGLDGGEEQDAADRVQDVVTWHSTRLAAERMTPVPDEGRIEELAAGCRAAVADQQQPATADP
ncbi:MULTISPECIES: hypothetical protein [unclassified Streptomyces]|uniref:hypothetical protein n=1 Tax=unclassified Streptomyces TaxID=2593676 RepID=UPI0035E1F9E2